MPIISSAALRCFVRGVLLLCSSVCLAPTYAQLPSGDIVPQGPIPHRNSEPLNTLFLTPQPASAFVLPANKSRLGMRFDVVNNFLTIREGTQTIREYITDFEEQRLYLTYSRGIGRGQEIGIQVGYIARNRGFLDSFINDWHRWFGFDGGGRENIPEYRTVYKFTDASGRSVFNSERGTSGISDTVIEYRRELTTLSADRPDLRAIAATARASLKLPTGRSTTLLGSGAADMGIGLDLTARPNRRFAIHANGSLVFVGKPKIVNLGVHRTQFQTLLAVEYLWNGRTSLVFQTDDNPAPFRSGIAYPDRSRRAFTAGIWRQLNNTNRLYLSIAENDFGSLAKHAPDVVLSLGADWRL
jgi:hypothetical protein